MLGDADIHASIAVRDIDAAKKFYVDTLGIHIAQENEMGLMLLSGGTRFLVYVSEYAGTNQATAAFWEVDDVEACVQELKDKGITFEHYDDMEGVQREGEVHSFGPIKAAWFKDPDGNILSVGSNM